VFRLVSDVRPIVASRSGTTSAAASLMSLIRKVGSQFTVRTCLLLTPPARATEVAGIAGGCLHQYAEASRGQDHRGGNGGLELGTAVTSVARVAPFEDHYRGGHEMTAHRNDDEAGRQL
jgi:hypothetical protein